MSNLGDMQQRELSPAVPVKSGAGSLLGRFAKQFSDSPVSSLNRKMKAPFVLSMSVHWLMRQVFVLLLALSVGASGTEHFSFRPPGGTLGALTVTVCPALLQTAIGLTSRNILVRAPLGSRLRAEP